LFVAAWSFLSSAHLLDNLLETWQWSNETPWEYLMFQVLKKSGPYMGLEEAKAMRGQGVGVRPNKVEALVPIVMAMMPKKPQGEDLPAVGVAGAALLVDMGQNKVEARVPIVMVMQEKRQGKDLRAVGVQLVAMGQRGGAFVGQSVGMML
jgi:hypothetical protein